MNYWKEFGKKTWIDWLKILVAVDIAGAGIGLILNIDMHVFGYLLRVIGLGFLSRIIFGVLYVLVAVLIFKRIFPQPLAKEEQEAAIKMDEEITETATSLKKTAQKISKKAVELTDKAHAKIDDLLDKGEEFIDKRKQEVKDEIKNISK